MKPNLFLIAVILFLSSCKKEGLFYLSALEPEQREITMMVGEETTLRVAKFSPYEPKDYELRWRIANSSTLIDLDSISGKVTAKAAGYAAVYIYFNGEHRGTCEIYIEGVFDEKNDVYLCGYSNSRPVYWKNGFVHTLNTTKEYWSVNPTAIDVYNDDVYVVGYANGNSNSDVVCWKNGEQIFSYEQGTSTKYKLFVDKNDFYILGFIRDPIIQKTAIWKNGERTDFLLENGTRTHSIFVSYNDVYVAGETTYDLIPTSETTYLNCTIAKYWKNGQEICLTDSNSVAGAWDIAVVGEDVHVVGWKYENEIRVAKYWKNNEEFNLNGNASWSSDAHSIVVNRNDVYILGFQRIDTDSYIPVYWKNGIKTELEYEGDYLSPNNIAIANGDVYIAMSYEDYYFKNGEKIYFEKLYPDYPYVTGMKVVSK